MLWVVRTSTLPEMPTMSWRRGFAGSSSSPSVWVLTCSARSVRIADLTILRSALSTAFCRAVEKINSWARRRLDYESEPFHIDLCCRFQGTDSAADSGCWASGQFWWALLGLGLCLPLAFSEDKVLGSTEELSSALLAFSKEPPTFHKG